jgi:predicted ATPase
MELKSQISLGVALMATKGYTAPEVKGAYDRARELCQQIGKTSQLAPVLLGLATFYYVRAELGLARELGEQLVSLVQGQEDESLLLEAHLTLGGTLSSLGEFPSALSHLQQGIHLYDPQRHARHAVLYGQDPGVLCLSRASHVLWFLGYPDQALARSEEALTLAKRCGHPYSLAYALSFAAILHQLRQEAPAAQARAEEAIALSTEQGFPTWKSASTIYRGWALACQEAVQEGLVSLREGIEAWQTAGAEIARPQFLVLLAETYALGGQIEDGLAAIQEGVTLASATGDQWAEAELWRLKGDLLLRGRTLSQRTKGKGKETGVEIPQSEFPTLLFMEEAESCFLQALDLARRQQAKSMELRIAIDLSRLWHQQGRSADAYQLLAGILSWFREGFGTRDLVAAKKLLEELHGSV